MLFANRSSEICSRCTCCGQYRARNWNWIGLYWNRFELTKLLSSDINIPKWGFRTWNNGHSCHLCSIQCIFPTSEPQLCDVEKKKKNYRSKISLRDQSHFARSKQPHFPRNVHEPHCGSLNVFVPAFSEFFSSLSRLAPTNSSAVSKPFDVYLRWRPRFQDACIAYSRATLLRDPSTRNIS